MEYLQWINDSEEGRAWLRSLPGVVDHCASRWRLTLDDPFPYVYRSLVVPARLEDGTDAVLKVLFPDRETEHEEHSKDGAATAPSGCSRTTHPAERCCSNAAFPARRWQRPARRNPSRF